MSTLDTLFPKKQDCYLALFQDAIYEHKFIRDSNNNIQTEYEFEDGQLKRRDRKAVLIKIAEMADIVYAELAQEDSSLSKCKLHIDYYNLLGVVSRYSRDIYGLRRLKAKLKNLEMKEEDIEKIIEKRGEFGFKISSANPYIHRQTAVLLYWFSVLKPFSLDLPCIAEEELPSQYIIAFFNEYFAYSLINHALYTQSSEMTIHNSSEAFFWEEFMNEMHYRNLSRSSFDFFLPQWMNEEQCAPYVDK